MCGKRRWHGGRRRKTDTRRTTRIASREFCAPKRCQAGTRSAERRWSPPSRHERGYSPLVVGHLIVRVAVQPALTGLGGGDHGMFTVARVLARVPVRRRIAAEGHAAALAGALSTPVRLDHAGTPGKSAKIGRMGREGGRMSRVFHPVKTKFRHATRTPRRISAVL